MFDSLFKKTGYYFSAAKKFALKHKILSVLIALIIIGGGWGIVNALTSTKGETRYVLGTVEKRTIISNVSASGQVAATNQVDVKPKASGEITWVGVKAGDKVYAGQALGALDNTDAKQSVADAQ